ncbi:TorF family putative porin [Pontiella sp.]|uniref:TorF family putative porin n=1 Tax=Pontiella sp. TaxID=2837462 RepID=UPI003568063C
MKKFMVVGMAAVFAAGFANAQGDVVMVGQAPSGGSSEAEASAELALVSADVWRGQVRNEDFVFQPQLSIEQYGVSFNIWANYDISKNYMGVENDISEIDLSLAYTLPLNLNDVSFDLGVINYQFPANGPAAGPTGVNSESTTELFVSAYWLTFKDYVLPSVTFFGDIEEVDGTYILFDVVAPYQISEYLAVEGGVSTGWGNGRYNKAYFGTSGGNPGFVDFNFYGTVSYELLDNLTASFNLTYTGLYGGSRKDNAKQIYEAGEKFWGGFNLAYDF